ncbi:hypothetical protein NQ318_013897 [Aromia moschata]|uniref:dolichol kinase n=1 Tax=Aromia moschata TaxID=1265417 RepID=A0AAV8Z8T4_9CUCU|nr:hypothetical protein NQ318_013897 [Aromia moschata]
MATETSDFGAVNDIKTRPNAGDGVWVLFLLPVSLIVSSFKHPIVLTPTYKLSSILSTGLLLTSALVAFQKYKNQKLRIDSRTILAFIFTSVLFHICFHKDWLFSILSGLAGTVFYFKAYIFVLRKFEKCFTLGEAALVTQGVIILLYFTFVNVFNSSHHSYRTNLQISTLIIQIGLLGIGAIAASVYYLNIKSIKSFYLLTFLVLTLVVFLPLHILLKQSPLLWILDSIFSNLAMLKLVIYWSFCTGIAVLTVSNQIFYAKKASSGMRKVFHILAVVVYIPGLLYGCSFLYLASGVVLGIFFTLEILRILNMPPLGMHLQDGFAVFSDEKDTGNLALTPVYLLAGCSLPLWIHPSPCDVTDSAMFSLTPLLSGLLSIGVGDTAASIVGSHYGKHFWKGSKKTIEGTVACVLSQIGLIYLLIYFGCLEYLSLEQSIKLYLAVFVTSIVEAKTTQVDNLVLPLVMYIILI